MADKLSTILYHEFRYMKLDKSQMIAIDINKYLSDSTFMNFINLLRYELCNGYQSIMLEEFNEITLTIKMISSKNIKKIFNKSLLTSDIYGEELCNLLCDIINEINEPTDKT